MQNYQHNETISPQEEKSPESVSVIEIFDSTVFTVPDTPSPPSSAPSNHNDVPSHNITIPETQNLPVELPEEEIPESENMPDDLSPEEQCSQEILDLRMRRTRSATKAIDLRLNITRKSRRLSESSIPCYNHTRSYRRNLSQSMNANNSKFNATFSATILTQETVKETSVRRTRSLQSIVPLSREPTESEVPRELEVIAESNPVDEELELVDEINPVDEELEVIAEIHPVDEEEAGTDRSVTPLLQNRLTSELTTPQIFEKINKDFIELLVSETQNIIGPPEEFNDVNEVDAPEILNESISGTFHRNGQFQKVCCLIFLYYFKGFCSCKKALHAIFGSVS